MTEIAPISPSSVHSTAADLPPVWTDATASMKVDVAINKDGLVWILHDRPFPDIVEWVEFDIDSKIMTFITYGGKLQNLGISIHPPMDEKIARARSVFVMQVQNGEIRDMGRLPLITQQKHFYKTKKK
jgi:hypothetical protein